MDKVVYIGNTYSFNGIVRAVAVSDVDEDLAYVEFTDGVKMWVEQSKIRKTN